ncbi:hypothetical protein KFU94_09130 [Chloroflexi bacterium TSY]|nr:hypothetical protein [Chloroflexi bacterium TSY]
MAKDNFRQESTVEVSGTVTLEDWRKQAEASRKKAAETIADFEDDS